MRVRCWDLHAVVSPLPLALSEIVRPLELQELGGVMRTLGQDPSEEDLKKIIAEVDQDGSGALARSPGGEPTPDRATEGTALSA